MRLLVVATRYDAVTEQTFRIAQRLVERTATTAGTVESLLEADAVASEIAQRLCEAVSVLALYSHGDSEGRILGQDQVPCWADEGAPNLNGAIVYAHACRGFTWLTRQSTRLRTQSIWGYAVDLLQPMQAPEGFWDMYCEIHSFLPASLLSGADAGTIQREFYYLCTDIFDQLAGSGAGLQELLAVTQSRDRLERHSPGAN